MRRLLRYSHVIVWLVFVFTTAMLFQRQHDTSSGNHRLVVELRHTVKDLCDVVERVNPYGDAQVAITTNRLRTAEDFIKNAQPGESQNLVARIRFVLPDYRKQREQALRLARSTKRPASCPVTPQSTRIDKEK